MKFSSIKKAFVKGWKPIVSYIPFFFIALMLISGKMFYITTGSVFCVAFALMFISKKSKFIVNLVNDSFGFIIATVLVLVINLIWGAINLSLNFSQNFYYSVLLGLMITVMSWFKFFMHAYLKTV